MYYYTKNTGRRKRKREVEGDGNEQLTREDPFWIKWQVRLVGCPRNGRHNNEREGTLGAVNQ